MRHASDPAAATTCPISSRHRSASHLACATASSPFAVARHWVLSRTHEFADDRLARVIAATFARRQTEIPVEPPDALTVAFAEDPVKLRQWAALAIDIATEPGSLAEVIDDLIAFLIPHAAEARMLRP
jgi:hypothetical protein